MAIEAGQEAAILQGLELYAQKRIQTAEELWQRLYNEPLPAGGAPAEPVSPVPTVEDIPEPEAAEPRDGGTVVSVPKEEPVRMPPVEPQRRERYFVPPRAPESQPVREPTLGERIKHFFRR